MPNAKCQMPNVKCQMLIRLNFYQSVPPELLRSFFVPRPEKNNRKILPTSVPEPLAYANIHKSAFWSVGAVFMVKLQLSHICPFPGNPPLLPRVLAVNLPAKLDWLDRGRILGGNFQPLKKLVVLNIPASPRLLPPRTFSSDTREKFKKPKK